MQAFWLPALASIGRRAQLGLPPASALVALAALLVSTARIMAQSAATKPVLAPKPALRTAKGLRCFEKLARPVSGGGLRVAPDPRTAFETERNDTIA